MFTQLDSYPFTTVEAVVNGVAENHYFSKIDLKSAYHQVPIKPEDRPCTAFEAEGNLYRFCRLAFGLTNVVPTFQRITDDFMDLRRRFHIWMTSRSAEPTKEEHEINLQNFLNAARKIIAHST